MESWGKECLDGIVQWVTKNILYRMFFRRMMSHPLPRKTVLKVLTLQIYLEIHFIDREVV